MRTLKKHESEISAQFLSTLCIWLLTVFFIRLTVSPQFVFSLARG